MYSIIYLSGAKKNHFVNFHFYFKTLTKYLILYNTYLIDMFYNLSIDMQ